MLGRIKRLDIAKKKKFTKLETISIVIIPHETQKEKRLTKMNWVSGSFEATARDQMYV